MYDLVPPNMKAQFNLINLSNQSIKLTVNVSNKVSNKKSLINYSYNKITIFKYQITIKNSQIFLEIFYNNSNNIHFYKTVLGSFIYDLSIKYSCTLFGLAFLYLINRL